MWQSLSFSVQFLSRQNIIIFGIKGKETASNRLKYCLKGSVRELTRAPQSQKTVAFKTSIQDNNKHLQKKYTSNWKNKKKINSSNWELHLKTNWYVINEITHYKTSRHHKNNHSKNTVKSTRQSHASVSADRSKGVDVELLPGACFRGWARGSRMQVLALQHHGSTGAGSKPDSFRSCFFYFFFPVACCFCFWLEERK